MLQIRGADASVVARPHALSLDRLAAGEVRRASDGWHAVVPLGGAIHRLWLPELPASGASIAVELRLDADFDIRLQAAHRFWSALEERPIGPSVPPLSLQRRQRLTLAIRALDGWTQGNSYREIAEGLFGKYRIPSRAWKTHDLRSRTIRLVQTGLALMRGGYRALLRDSRKER
ncbi:DNA -binding domain-containing protein [Bradyrhizobium japonicum]|uniref:DUF2285 domain-containing protein n=1 Tax=Bradyrhizobium japonicum TaxID=375 RepID=UPI0004628877